MSGINSVPYCVTGNWRELLSQCPRFLKIGGQLSVTTQKLKKTKKQGIVRPCTVLKSFTIMLVAEQKISHVQPGGYNFQAKNIEPTLFNSINKATLYTLSASLLISVEKRKN